MLKKNEILQKLTENFKSLFESTGVISLKNIIRETSNLFPGQKDKPDLVAEVITRDNKKFMLVFEVKSLGQPRYARLAISQLKDFLEGKENAYGIFVSAFISEESRRECQKNGVGYIDLAGNCLLNFENIFINIDGRPNPYPESRPLKSIFSARSSRAIRVLLCNPGKEWTLSELSKEAIISLGQAFSVKKRLLDYELIKEEGKGKNMRFRLVSPEQLLKKWADNYDFRKNKIWNFYSFDDVEKAEKKLADYLGENNILYGFTLTSGASLVAPFVRYTRVYIYVKNNIEKIAADLNLKQVSTGPNVTILEPYDEGVFYRLQDVKGMKVVSDVQLYLDLKSNKERGEEAASFILEQRLRKRW
jgi:hypothetical protein